MTDLNNKTILITGASRGIGEATAKHFARAGANVVMFARSGEALKTIADEITSEGGKAIAIEGDVSSYADLENAVKRTVDEFGKLDILLNNAGVIEPIAHIADSDPEFWDKVVDINFKGVYHGIRASIPEMLKAGGGVIINISSGAATNALEGWSHYCSTKAAVLSLTACTAKEYGGKGIRVVGLSPGTVATEMQVAIRKSGINPVSQLDPSVHIPAGWVAQAVEYLCGEGGKEFEGTDFSLRADVNRKRLGLPTAS